jgi:hypothetical protein
MSQQQIIDRVEALVTAYKVIDRIADDFIGGRGHNAIRAAMSVIEDEVESLKLMQPDRMAASVAREVSIAA